MAWESARLMCNLAHVVDELQLAQRRLIQRMLEYAQTDATNLARRAGVASTTLTRFMNQPVKHLLSARTLAKLLQASGLPQGDRAAWLRAAGAEGQAVVLLGYVVEQEDQVMLLQLWDELTTAQKLQAWSYLQALSASKKTGAA